jgi:hypothetical protein
MKDDTSYICDSCGVAVHSLNLFDPPVAVKYGYAVCSAYPC